jgi:hypothetical protein
MRINEIISCTMAAQYALYSDIPYPKTSPTIRTKDRKNVFKIAFSNGKSKRFIY